MNCAEFQKVLPDVMESVRNAEEEAHLKSCAVCSALVQDLEQIAESARLLLPMQDPSPRVWAGIREALEQEGLVRPPLGTARFRPPAALSPRRWLSGGSLLAVAAVLLFTISILWFTNHARQGAQSVATATAVAPAAVDEDDARLLSAVQQRSPDLLPTYRENLDTVNAYIRDAQRTVEQDPYDLGAHDHLLRAYNQKALLYEMALARFEE